jgi:maltose O-acetyltransferase
LDLWAVLKITKQGSGQVAPKQPFFCDYGSNIYIGRGVFFNFNCIGMDVNRVDIGDNVLFGPNVQIYTATHPIGYKERQTGLELGMPIKIGTDG